MSRRITYRSLILCALMAFFAGCTPEDSLQWSEDGSVGLLGIDDALYVVDGQSGDLTEVAKEQVSLFPDLSRDGGLIAYGQEVQCPSLAEGLKWLPAGQVKMIAKDANRLREKALSSELADGNLNALFKGDFERVEPYDRWLVRYACENADERLIQKIGTEKLNKYKQMPISCFRLAVVAPGDLDNKRIVVTSVLRIVQPKFSPNGNHIAYLMMGPEEDDQASLFIASLKEDVKAMHVASRVALGHDWRPDSRAVAYLQQDGDEILGVLRESVVADENDRLKSKPLPDSDEGAFQTHHCTSSHRQFAGTLFTLGLLMKIQYGPSGRVFFSSPCASIPTSELDEPRYSVFCYDSITATVANLFPSAASGYVDENVNFFTLSPDGTKLLLPLKKNRFAIYHLGTTDWQTPIPETEEFGDDTPELLAAWKGNDQISCLVSENSQFLTGNGQDKHHRKEIVLLGTDGKLQRLLSTSWPDAAIPGQTND